MRFEISIHALREEGDLNSLNTGTGGADFYPRPPRGGRRYAIEDVLLLVFISIHALREEGDGRNLQRRSKRLISIHALREEGDTAPYRFRP